MDTRYPKDEAQQDRLRELLQGLEGNEIESIQHKEHLKGRALPACVDIHDTGYIRSSTRASEAAKEIAATRTVPGRFDAFRVKYHPEKQLIILIPEAAYVESDEELEPVSWSPDEREFRTDLYDKLVAKNWETPHGMIRRVSVYAVDKLPGIGPALLLDMSEGELRPRPRHKKPRTRTSPQSAVPNQPPTGQQSTTPDHHPAATDDTPSDEA